MPQRRWHLQIFVISIFSLALAAQSR